MDFHKIKPSEGNRRDAIASWLGDDVRGLLDHFDDMVRMFRGLDLYSARETCDLVVDRLADAYKERVQPDYESLASIVWDVLIDVVDAVEFEKVKDEDRWSA